MTSPRLYKSHAFFALTALFLGFSAPISSATSPAGAQLVESQPQDSCTPILSEPTKGQKVKAERKNVLPEAASRNGKGEEEFSTLLDDETLWLDTCGMTFYVEPTSLQWDSVQGNSPYSGSGINNGKNDGKGNKPDKTPPPVTEPLPIDLTKTFNLHSRAGAKVTLYLDFNGHTISGTAWNAAYTSGTAWNALGYSLDGDYTTFNSTEMTNIWNIWYQVAEDYAALNVDVTTELPAAGVLERTDLADTTYGSRVLISDDPVISGQCGCGGISYVGVIDYPGTNHEYYQPSWIFSKALGYNNRYISEAVTHEAGHSLGLSHDGTTTPAASYYSGSSGWAPIMGVGYYQPLVQWSKGEYPNANNLEDDFAVMASHGATLATDEDSNSLTTSRSVWVGGSTSGVITSATDSDWFKIVPSATGSFTFNVNPSPVSPDLDVAAKLYDATGTTLIAASNPILAVVSSEVATGLGASITVNLTSGQSYYLALSGTGNGSLATGGYSSYGSVGAYSVIVNGPVGPLSIVQPASQSISAGIAYSLQLNTGGGYAPFTWSATGLPAGLTISSSGLISGIPTTMGTYTVTATVVDGLSNTSSTSFLITVMTPLLITTKSLTVGINGLPYSSTVAATGGTAPYVWTATKLPAWAVINASTGVISGTPNAIATTSIVATATDALGTKVSVTLSLVVVAPVAITTTSITSPTRLKAYKFTMTASGGSGTKVWSLASGTLPSGITISSSGVISGNTSVAKGSKYTFAIKVADSYTTSTKSYSITIN